MWKKEKTNVNSQQESTVGQILPSKEYSASIAPNGNSTWVTALAENFIQCVCDSLYKQPFWIETAIQNEDFDKSVAFSEVPTMGTLLSVPVATQTMDTDFCQVTRLSTIGNSGSCQVTEVRK